MKSIYIVIVLAFFTSLAVLAQNKKVLKLRNYNTNNLRYIHEGSKVHAIRDGKVCKGILKIISEKTIAINSDTLQISQIQEISAKTTSRTVGGVALLIPSAYIGGLGIWAVAAGLGSLDNFGALAIVIGAPLAVVGLFGIYAGAKFIFNGRKFSPSRWEYSIWD